MSKEKKLSTQEMAEAFAVMEINTSCKTGDYEGNGYQLDKIIYTFLRRIGSMELAEVYENVECWRA